MKVMRAALAVAVAAIALVATSATAVDFHGYLRTGIGGNSNGGGQVCFGSGTPLTANGYKFRLGNECENYAELEFAQTLYKDKSGAEFFYDGMLAYVTPAVQDFESLKAANADIALRQNWIGAKGLPFLGGSMVWVGKRYYFRNDIHEIDFFYWDPSGPGAGIQDIDLGFGKLAFAIFQSKNSDLRQIWRPDIRVYGIPVNPNGALEIGLDVYYDSAQTRSGLATPPNPNPDRQKTSPWITVQHTQSNLLGGFNKLAFQWASGSAAPMSAYPQFDNGSGSKQWRVVDHLVFAPNAQFSGAAVVHFADMTKRYGGTGSYNSAKQFGIGVRPAYHFSDFFKLQGEIGYQTMDFKDAGIDTMNVVKVTIAPTIMPPPGPGGPYFTRPELRLFLTYANWNKGAQAQGIVGQSGTCDATTTTSAFKCDTNGLTFGAQAEAWW